MARESTTPTKMSIGRSHAHSRREKRDERVVACRDHRRLVDSLVAVARVRTVNSIEYLRREANNKDTQKRSQRRHKTVVVVMHRTNRRRKDVRLSRDMFGQMLNRRREI
jgi:hypothetical protein